MKTAALVLVVSTLLVGCASAPDDAVVASSRLDQGECLTTKLSFDPALFADLKKTVAAAYVTDDAVRIPGSLTAHLYPDAFPVPETEVNTALGIATSIEVDPTTGQRHYFARIGGRSPDELGGDVAAHRLYEAMDVPEASPFSRRKVSKDGLFECELTDWKGGTIKTCTFKDVIGTTVTGYGDAQLCGVTNDDK
jgi:hypothetical protein